MIKAVGEACSMHNVVIIPADRISVDFAYDQLSID